MATTEKTTTKKKSSKKRKGSKKSGLMGLGSIAKTFSVSKLTELAKTGGLLLVGYAVGNLAGKAVANAVNKNEQNPQGLKKYINALAQGTIAAVCVSMGGKRTWLKNVGMGAALSAVQTTVETISGKSVLDMLSFGNKTATNGVDGLGAGEELILPPLEGGEDKDPDGGINAPENPDGGINEPEDPDNFGDPEDDDNFGDPEDDDNFGDPEDDDNFGDPDDYDYDGGISNVVEDIE